MNEFLTIDENIIYQLETLASYEPDDLYDPEFEVMYEYTEIYEGFVTVCCVDLAKRTLDLIKRLKENK